MSDFSHLQKFDVDSAETVDYELYQIDGEAVLEIAPATDANKPFFNATLRRSRKSVRALNAGAISPAMIHSNRVEDRKLFASYIVKGWRGVMDSEGRDVPFTPDNCAAFMDALPSWIFDELRVFATTPANFLDEGISEAEETGKA